MSGDNQQQQQLSSMSRLRAKFRRSTSTSTSLSTQTTSTPPSPSAINTLQPSSPSSQHQHQHQHQRQRKHRLSFVSSLFGTEESDDDADVETLKANEPESSEETIENNNQSNKRPHQPTDIPVQAEAAVVEAPPAASDTQPSDQPDLQHRSSQDDSSNSNADNKPDRAPTLTSPIYANPSSTPLLDSVGESLPSPGGSLRSRNPSIPRRPSLAIRRQSLVPASQHRLIRNLLDQPSMQTQAGDYFSTPNHAPSIRPDMVHRKVWVKRLGSSATLVSVTEEDLIDDLRDVILKKYTNSLGKNFDAPDLILRLIPREQSSRQTTDRLLGPEEPVGRTLDAYYPGGQTINEALIIEIMSRRTPKPSPRQANIVYAEDLRPGEAGDYFSPMPYSMATPPHAPSNVSSASGPNPHVSHIPSMSVITTGQVPPVPSPGNRGSWNQQPQQPQQSQQQPQQHQPQPQQQQQPRPNYHRQHTTSPTILTISPSNLTVENTQSINGVAGGPAPPPSPPAPVADQAAQKASGTPPARVSSPRPSAKLRKPLNPNAGVFPSPGLPSRLLDGTVPPISVLIVEDNIINLKLLEAFMKRLKVRWQTAMNGREAVNKWRTGGFHLVLMDIQLPVMNGLDATKEIRRLERLNNIGVFSKNGFGVSSTVGSSDGDDNSPREAGMDPKPEDALDNLYTFKSPIIIVALTASSLQSDRHEALAAGCNDFLTKPVNFVWLEQKVTEWGCMQALIDFEGWRKWRGFADPPNQTTTNTGSGEKSESTTGRGEIEKLGVDRLIDSSLAQRRAAASTAAKVSLTSDDYVSKGSIHKKPAVPESLGTGSGGSENTASTNSASMVASSARSPTLSSGFRESRRRSVPAIVPARK